MTAHEAWEPRAVCARCRRPARVCYCAHLTSIDTKTRIVLLQHTRERYVAIGTARMASLCLPNSELHVGVHFRDSPALARALSDPSRPAALLYPSPDAIDVFSAPPPGPVTLVVVDGTWWQAQKLVRVNPEIAKLPRYAFKAPAPSEYRIRKEPDEAYVSTIEALVHVLGVLEGDPERFRALLAPFRAMVDTQIHYASTVHGARERHGKGPRPPRRPRVPPILAEHPERVVCVSGEANAWPYRDRSLRTTHREELVHWVAHRVGTGETLDAIAAPRSPLAPSTASHVGLSGADLDGGGSLAELFAKWSAFVRDDDVICSWGPYAPGIFASAGGELPRERLEMRQVARIFGKGRVGSMEQVIASLGAEAPEVLARGRAGVRAGQLVRIAKHLGALYRESVSAERSRASSEDR
ncbi:MAG: DTW domain-containing protein [Labilithrix sp.]|nr:DTW domain-containing protein [Labilithrix sp.]